MKAFLNLIYNRLMHSIRLAIGVISSILLAELLHISFAPSTGIVALLGIQSTKKETIHVAVRRVISFLYTMAIAVAVHHYFGSGTYEFLLAITVIILLSVMLGWDNTLSINIVLLVHLFMQNQAFTNALLLNETKRIIIGMLIALAVNYRLKE